MINFNYLFNCLLRIFTEIVIKKTISNIISDIVFKALQLEKHFAFLRWMDKELFLIVLELFLLLNYFQMQEGLTNLQLK